MPRAATRTQLVAHGDQTGPTIRWSSREERGTARPMKRTHFVALLSAFLLAGCAAEPSDDAAAAATSEMSTTKDDGFTQFIPYVPRARIDAAFATFQGCNAGEWTMVTDGADRLLTSALGGTPLRRNVPVWAQTVTLDVPAQADVVRAFITKNADLLGIDAPSLAEVKPFVGQAFTVTGGLSPLLGLKRGVNFRVDVGRDGAVSSVIALGLTYPAITLDPSTTFDQDLLRRTIVGTQLFLEGKQLRTVTANDLGELHLGYVHANAAHGADGVTLTRVVSIYVSDEENLGGCSIPFTSWYLDVDAKTGQVLGGTETECLQW